jgi:hypothetical protein
VILDVNSVNLKNVAQLGFIIWMIFKDYPGPIIMFGMWASLSGLIIFSFIDLC